MNEDEFRRHSNVVMATLAWLLPFAWMGVGMTFGWVEAMMFGPMAVAAILVLGYTVRYLNGPDDFIKIDRKYQRMRNTANDCSDELVEDMIEHATLTPVPEKPNGDDVQPEASYREPAVQHVCRCGKLSHHG